MCILASNRLFIFELVLIRDLSAFPLRSQGRRPRIERVVLTGIYLVQTDQSPDYRAVILLQKTEKGFTFGQDRLAMWKAAGILLIIFITGTSVLQEARPKLRFTHLSGDQGLSNSTIEAIFQDSQGFIWIGTRDGLNRYDGHEMLVYRNDPADSGTLSDSYIHCVYEDREHVLWVGTREWTRPAGSRAGQMDQVETQRW